MACTNGARIASLCTLIVMTFGVIIIYDGLTKLIDNNVARHAMKQTTQLTMRSNTDSADLDLVYNATKLGRVATPDSTYEQLMHRRLKHVQEQCNRISNSTDINSMKPEGIIFQYKNMNYCYVPKVGCTYWKRIMRYISHDYPPGSNILKPSDIDRHFAHGGEFRKIKQIRDLKYNQNKRNVGNKTNVTFMFTRNPYTRLWSNYLDKFFLPDFWNIARRLGNASKQNITAKELKCGNYLTFTGFLTAIVNIWPEPLGFHWRPAHLICSPCHVQYDAIGEMENFAKDSKYILQKIGAQNVHEIASKRDLAYEEINTLTKYNFELLTRKPIVGRCITIREMAHRLWKTFQYNGYIDKLVAFPSDKFHNFDSIEQTTDSFIEIAMHFVDNQNRSLSSQKIDMMLEAYSEVPDEVLEKLKLVYKYDFEIFGYDEDLSKLSKNNKISH